MTKAQDNFRAKAPGIMDRLMAEFPLWDEFDAAADLGNLGHESGGLVTLQEKNPTAKGSKGGYGWPQWTGPRRRAYEAWCRKNKLDPAGDDANLGYHLAELHGEYNGVIKKVHAAKGLEAKVKAFELAYEGAGIKHYDLRNQWARLALDAWLNAHTAKPAGKPASAPSSAKAPDDGQTSQAAPAPSPAPLPPPSLPIPGKAEEPAPGRGLFYGLLALFGFGGAGGILSRPEPDQLGRVIVGGVAIAAIAGLYFWYRRRSK